jgi:GxxExxY protein
LLICGELTRKIIGGAIRVHRSLGPGLLESIYETCLVYELTRCGLCVDRQRSLPVVYDGVILDDGYRADLVVEESVIVEVKAVESVSAVHHAQLLTYLRLTGKPVGLLINFHVERLCDGIVRKVRTTGA